MHATARSLALLSLSCLAATSAAAQAKNVVDLPVVEVPATTGQTLALFWSGDGGWAALVSTVSKELAANGVSVVGIDSRAWLERGKQTPDDVARDTERLLRLYLTRWSRSRVLLLGYSRGAGFLPFIVSRLPADLRDRVELVGMLGAERTASFEFHIMDLIRDTARPTDLPVIPEMQRSSGLHYLCLYGTTERDTICPQLDAATVSVVSRVGDHHFDRNYPAIAQDILKAAATR